MTRTCSKQRDEPSKKIFCSPFLPAEDYSCLSFLVSNNLNTNISGWFTSPETNISLQWYTKEGNNSIHLQQLTLDLMDSEVPMSRSNQKCRINVCFLTKDSAFLKQAAAFVSQCKNKYVSLWNFSSKKLIFSCLFPSIAARNEGTNPKFSLLDPNFV